MTATETTVAALGKARESAARGHYVNAAWWLGRASAKASVLGTPEPEWQLCNRWLGGAMQALEVMERP